MSEETFVVMISSDMRVGMFGTTTRSGSHLPPSSDVIVSDYDEKKFTEKVGSWKGTDR